MDWEDVIVSVAEAAEPDSKQMQQRINNKLILLKSPITCSRQQSLILVAIYNFGLVVIWVTGYPSTHIITFKSLASNNFKEKIKLQ